MHNKQSDTWHAASRAERHVGNDLSAHCAFVAGLVKQPALSILGLLTAHVRCASAVYGLLRVHDPTLMFLLVVRMRVSVKSIIPFRMML